MIRYSFIIFAEYMKVRLQHTSDLLKARFIDYWKSPVCVTPKAQVPLTLESKFRMTPIKS